MLAANPEKGEVLLCEQGDSLFFRRDTWHHAFAHGPDPLRVIEFFAPPPSAGMSGTYAAKRPYLEESRYARDEILGNLAGPEPLQSLQRFAPHERSWRREGDLAVGLIASTEQLTVAEIRADPGAQGALSSHGGDAVIFGTEGELMVRTFWKNSSMTFEIKPHDAVFVPRGASYEVLNFGASAKALLGVAPRFLPA
jgi:quercetin dioxygenase-like cupin family protein